MVDGFTQLRHTLVGFERAAVALLFLLLCACQSSPDALRLQGFTMGTSYHVNVVGAGDEVDRDQLQSDLDKLLQVFNQITSTYIADSELNQFNDAPVGEWIPLSETLFDILLLSMEVSWTSGGAFDITVAPLVDLWGFGPGEHRDRVPDDSEIQALLQNVGFSHLELDFTEPRALKRKPVRVDLSAVAKGYGVDIVALWLERQGFANFMVEIGGEIRLKGHSPRGDNWRIAIEKPTGVIGELERALSLTDTAIATSGDYRNYFEQDGVRYSHTIDPATGRPVTHRLASVTVISDSAAYADAMATAFDVMGPERSLKLAEQEGIAVYLIVKTDTGFAAQYSPAFAKYLEQE